MRWPWRRAVREIGALRVMRLEAGDTVVLQVKEMLNQERSAYVKAVLQREFPDHKVLVLVGGAELSVLREGSPAAVVAPETGGHLRHEIRKGGIGHNEVVPATVVMTPNGPEIVRGQHPGEIGTSWT